MPRTAPLLALCCLLLTPAVTSAQPQPEVMRGSPDSLPVGWGGLWWGATQEHLRVMARGIYQPEGHLDDDIESYVETLDEDYGPATAFYRFYRDQLFEVVLYYDSETSRSRSPTDLVRALVARWGPVQDLEHHLDPDRGSQTPVAWTWRNELTEVTLRWDPEEQTYSRHYHSPLVRERMNEDERRERAEQRQRELEGLIGQ